MKESIEIIIIEDEKPAARRLKRMLKEMGINVQTMLHSVKESIKWFYENPHPDLILLDIQLSDGLSFEIFEEIEIKSAIIFTTAYDEYALKAFKLNSIDYLLKPIDEEDLKTAILKYESHQNKKPFLDIENLKKMLGANFELQYKNRFTIKIGQRLKIIPINETECFYTLNKGVYIYTTKKRSYLIDYSLEQLENRLNPKNFFRVNRKIWVNINFIKDIVYYTNSRLKIQLNNFNEFEIIVSREKVTSFKNWID